MIKHFLIQEEFNWLPEFISRATANIIQSLREQYPDGLTDIILEIKSCSSFMFEMYERKNKANPQHKLQLYHYLKCKKMSEGHIVYISKDDARMLEIEIIHPSSLEEEYKNDITTISNYAFNKIEPPKEKFIVFDKDFGKFSANYKVGYSNYLTMLYELKNQKAFDDIYKPMVERWNRVLGRIAEEKDMTDNNKEALEEMEKGGFDIEEIKKEVKDVVRT